MITHKDLDIWKLGIELVEKVYEMTTEFPKEEIYGLTNQMRRAAVSIPSNISEGDCEKRQKGIYSILIGGLRFSRRA
jgi:four helix bundle protein